MVKIHEHPKIPQTLKVLAAIQANSPFAANYTLDVKHMDLSAAENFANSYYITVLRH